MDMDTKNDSKRREVIDLAVSPETTQSTLSLEKVTEKLPPELIIMILRNCIGNEQFDVARGTLGVHYLIWQRSTFIPASKLRLLPGPLLRTYHQLRRNSLITSTKTFSDPSVFYMAHVLLAPERFRPPNHAWARMFARPGSLLFRSCQYIGSVRYPVMLNVLEKIHLDFSAAEYFSLFAVPVPPFSDSSHYANKNFMPGSSSDPFLHNAGRFLSGTKELTLHFGERYKGANPWGIKPGLVCDSGLVIDWILEFAWARRFLQHIPVIRLTGAVQPWVQHKWHRIFEAQAKIWKGPDGRSPARAYQAHPPETRTFLFESLDENDVKAWSGQDHYPPRCKCKTACLRVFGEGVVEGPLCLRTKVESWDWIDRESEEEEEKKVFVVPEGAEVIEISSEEDMEDGDIEDEGMEAEDTDDE